MGMTVLKVVILGGKSSVLWLQDILLQIFCFIQSDVMKMVIGFMVAHCILQLCYHSVTPSHLGPVVQN